MPAGWKPDPVKAALGEERTLWKLEVDEGFFRTNITDRFAVTNHRIVRNYTSVPLQHVEDIVVMNRRRVSKSEGTSTGLRRREDLNQSRYRSPYDVREIELASEGMTVGDVVFMSNGKAAMTFPGIGDPEGVAALARAARDNVVEILKTIPAEKKPDTKILCPLCKTPNIAGLKSCAGCGRSLAFVCAKCGRENPDDSSFCGSCGMLLQ
jgi:hypothetical protein